MRLQIEEKPPATRRFETPFAWIGGEEAIFTHKIGL